MDFSTAYSEYNLDKLESEISKLFPDINLQIDKLFMSVIEGKGIESIREILKSILHSLTGEVTGLRSVFIMLILLGIVSAVFVNLSGAFQNNQTAYYGFYVTYLIMIIFLVQIFANVFQITKETLDNIIVFVKLFLPTYLLTITASGGSMSAIGLSQLFLLAIYGIEALLIGVILPITGCYAVLCIMNGIWEEEKLNLLLHLIKKAITMSLKIILTIISATGILQSMITPVIDTYKMSVLQKTISVIPGLGDLAGSAAQMILGGAVLIKNTVGLLLLIFLIILCAVPLLKLFFIMIMLKGAAAIMGLAADKRMTNCANRMGDGVMLLFQTTLCSVTFFIILVSIAAFTTNRGL